MNILLAKFIEVKASADEPGVFEGYGSVFGNVDHGKDICVKGCFGRSLSEHKSNGSMPSMFYMHDRKLPIGDWYESREDSKGLWMHGKLWLGKGIVESERSHLMLKGTGPKGLSIGYQTKKSTYDQKSGVRSLEDVDLFEVSVVGHGMNPKAVVTSIKSRLEDGIVPTIREFEELLRDAGLSAKQAKAFLADGYKGLSRDDSLGSLSEDDAKALGDLLRAFRS